jgi:hypothetical protein
MEDDYYSSLEERISNGYIVVRALVSCANHFLTIVIKGNGETKTIIYRDEQVPVVKSLLSQRFEGIQIIQR